MMHRVGNMVYLFCLLVKEFFILIVIFYLVAIIFIKKINKM